jgi:endonuclease/exonuclease/phosphatase (EEP) superfamily protein YafD
VLHSADRAFRWHQTRVVRIVAWNCCQKFATNLGHLLELGFDLAVVAESAPGDERIAEQTDLTALFQAPLPSSPKHIGVLARAPWTVTAHPKRFPELPWLLPATVTGPVNFTVLAVWPVTLPGFPSYTGQLARVLAEAFPDDGSPVVLAGDLNAPTSATRTAHLRNVAALEGLGVRSGYLSTRGITAVQAHPSGAGPSAAIAEPTYYQHRRRVNGFHIDHIFLPKHWTIRGFDVGSYDEWVATGRSDHVPLIADVSAH